jgi:hypothetical protein
MPRGLDEPSVHDTVDLERQSGWDGSMSKRDANAAAGRKARRKRVPSQPKRSRTPVSGARRTSPGTRQVMALVREAEAEEHATNDFMQGYAARQRLEQRLSALAERIADRPHPSRDDLLALALAGWYAGGARQALVRTLLRAGGIDPREPRLTMRRRSQLPGRILPQ